VETPPKKMKLALLVATLVAVSVGWFFVKDNFTIESLAAQENQLRAFHDQHASLMLGLAFVIYVVVTGLSLPGAAIMTLVLGWFFGFWKALLVVSFASTAGATLAFLLSRYFLNDFVQSKFGSHLEKFNEALAREGAFYLFTLRLIPVVPFFVINVVMGLTSIKIRTYWWVSQVGMLAGTCVFVYAGTTIPSLDQISDPALLRVSDISDWSGFQNEIAKPKTPPAARLANQLPAQIVDECKAGTLDDEQKLATTNALNELLKQPDFALDPAWQSQESDQRESSKKQLSAINRSVLVYSFPNLVLPPQPILSKQLLLAFVLLGFFPLVAKKLLQRFRGPSDQPEAAVPS
jgi:uncharacterized membrane protein YdjX (TVP38/TMEM64 family)